jgi:hypothetical protein
MQKSTQIEMHEALATTRTCYPCNRASDVFIKLVHLLSPYPHSFGVQELQWSGTSTLSVRSSVFAREGQKGLPAHTPLM